MPDSGLKNSRKIIVINSCLLLLAFFGGYGALLVLEKHDWGDTSRLYSQIYDVATLEAKMGIANYYLENGILFALQPQQASAADKQVIENFAGSKPAPQVGDDFGELKGRNVFFIQLESFEDWVVNDKIGDQEITPNLNQLAEQGEYFNNYYSEIAEGNTADAEFSTMNSLYPLPDTVAFITKAQNQYYALPKLLDQNGYYTAVMHGDVATFWNRSNMYPALGYDQQFSSTSYKITRPVGFDGLGDQDFFQQSMPFLKNLNQPFLATMITLSSHTPFTLPSDLQTLNIPADSVLNQTQKEYVQSIHYTDQALGQFFDSLKQVGLYNNSIFVIYGDHNAFIGTADSATNHVPLVILAPGSNITGTNSEPGSHIDLYPTVADLLGITPPKNVLGQDLFTTKTPVAVQRNIGSGTIKFILSSNLKYTGSADGVFGSGKCQQLPSGSQVPVDDCKQLYDQQVLTTEVSDLAVRYNQISLLNGK